ncbi:MAG: Hpt domain-containing protein [Gemmatimonadales bacterium]|nr:Hpt domain-containing protein [Gemmatimonadales bacterium]
MSQEVQTIESILNLQSAMGNLDGDVELLQEIMEIFVEIAPEQLNDLYSLIQADKAAEVDILAHGLKGSASNFCASKFVGTAFKLEHLAKTGSLVGAEELQQQLRAEFVEIQDLQLTIDWKEIARQWSP